jgi:prevent-host-death family protein
MIQLSVYDTKAKLSALIEAVLKGENVVITRRGTPVVQLVPYQAPTWEPVLTPLPGFRANCPPGEDVAPVYPDGIPWSADDPV